MRRILFISLIAIIFVNCKNSVVDHKEIIASFIGREIIFPTDLRYFVQEDKIDLDIDKADYKIMTYLSSDGCTSCKMRLRVWNEFLNDIISRSAENISFVMILNPNEQKYEEAVRAIKTSKFNHPVSFDKEDIFIRTNHLPDDEIYHTVLLDKDNRVLVVGNPTSNPKIKELYLRHMLNEENHNQLPKSHVKALGVVCPGQGIKSHFTLENNTDSNLTIKEIVPSCSYITGELKKKILGPYKRERVDIAYSPENTEEGRFIEYINIYFYEKQNPEKFLIHGYITNMENKTN